MTNADHSAAQPIVCCIGTSVAGQPTQFLFERAVESLRIDWRAISVEVPIANTKTACDGMLAMRFKGIRLFGELQTQAVSALAGTDKSAQFIGHLTSGVSMNDHWLCWDHVGYAWIELIQRFQANRSPVVWLHGDSRTTRSTFVALMSLGGKAPKWLWTQAAEFEADSFWQKDLDSWVAEGRIHLQSASANTRSLLTRWLTESESQKVHKKDQPAPWSSSEAKASTTQTNPAAPTQPAGGVPTLLAFISEEAQMPVELSESLSGLPVELLTSATTKPPPSISEIPMRQIQPGELIVAGEVYDFHRWTNRKVDSDLMQDAFDEYSDF